MSSDLTPLAAISGYCELYAMGGVPAECIDEVMGRISSESSRMANLVEDLLTLARLDEGRPLEITDIDLVKLADNAVFDLQALDPTRTVGLTGINGRTPPMTLIVPADRDRISQVFTNLIGNIVRYTPEGSPVEIALGRSGNTAIIELRDYGPGIDEIDRGRVFERFHRADTSRNRKSGGSGLGLAIVSGILTAHKGQRFTHQNERRWPHRPHRTAHSVNDVTPRCTHTAFSLIFRHFAADSFSKSLGIFPDFLPTDVTFAQKRTSMTRVFLSKESGPWVLKHLSGC